MELYQIKVVSPISGNRLRSSVPLCYFSYNRSSIRPLTIRGIFRRAGIAVTVSPDKGHVIRRQVTVRVFAIDRVILGGDDYPQLGADFGIVGKGPIFVI